MRRSSMNENKEIITSKETSEIDLTTIENYRPQNFQIKISSIIKLFAIVTFALLVLSLGSNIYYYLTNDLAYFKSLFDLDSEQNLPTRIASGLLIIASFLFFTVYAVKNRSKDKFRYHWFILSLIFFVMAMDESLMLHEQTSQFLRGTISGLYFAWVIPGAIFVLLFAAAYLKFFLNLESRWKKLFFFSAFIFLSGALGMELVTNFYQNTAGQENIVYSLLTNFEELLEFSGVILLIYSLATYLMHLSPLISIELKK
jgi:hypothetical protein